MTHNSSLEGTPSNTNRFNFANQVENFTEKQNPSINLKINTFKENLNVNSGKSFTLGKSHGKFCLDQKTK